MSRSLSIFALLGLGLVGCDTAPEADLFTDGADDELVLAQEMSSEILASRGIQFRPVRTTIDELSIAHTRFQQLHDGVRVFEGEAIVHLGADGALRGLTDALIYDLDVDTTPLYQADEAIDVAVEASLGWEVLTDAPESELVVLRRGAQDHLAWRIQLDRQDGTVETSRPVLFIDAHTGDEIWRYENLKAGTGTSNYSGTVNIETTASGGDYYLEDSSAGMGTYTFANTYGSLYYLTDSDDSWTDSTTTEGVDAQYAGSGTLDYFLTTFGRDGLDGSGGPGYITSLSGSDSVISLFVNYGVNYVNAYWSGSYMVFGDGNGSSYGPLTTMDITGHEMTHGITESEANLTYYGESGALDEAYADVFGAMVERHLEGEDSDNWLVGEDCYTPSIANDGAVRYMNDPTADGASRDHYASRYTGSADSGGVHWNSGIGNLSFYLLSEGGSHPTRGGDAMTGIGMDDAAAIWYRGLTNYLTSSSDFSDARDAHLSAAADLYGEGSTEYAAVQDAWHLVGIGDAAPEDTGSEDTGAEDTGAEDTGAEDTGAEDTGAEVDPCEGYDSSYAGTLSDGGSAYEPNGTYYQTSIRGDHVAQLVGPSSADFDLYLYKYNPRRGWIQIDASESSSSDESISHFTGRGIYLWEVVSYSGSGDYTLCVTTP